MHSGGRAWHESGCMRPPHGRPFSFESAPGRPGSGRQAARFGDASTATRVSAVIRRAACAGVMQSYPDALRTGRT